MRAPAIIWDTVEATGDWAQTAEWDVTVGLFPAPLSVEALCAILDAFEKSFEGSAVVELELFVDVEADVDEVHLRGEGVAAELSRRHAGRTVSRGAEAVISLSLWVQDPAGALSRGIVEPAGRLWINDEGDAISITITLSVNVYSDRILRAQATDDGLTYETIDFAAAAERNRGIVAGGLRAFVSAVDGAVTSCDSEVIELDDIGETGVLAPGRLRADARPVLRRVGGYRELGMGDELPSIRQAPRTAELADREKLIQYLRNGVRFAAIPLLLKDAFDDSVAVGAPNLCTDGTYVWSELLPYYVEKYGISLCQDFIDHARARGWKVQTHIDPSTLRL